MNDEETTIERDHGFTLIELLIAIVVVGILSAVAILGISSLTNSGATSACNATRDASEAATAVYYANTGGFPANFTVLTPAANPYLRVTGTANVASPTTVRQGPGAAGWTLTLTPGAGAAAPTFACTP